MTRTPAFAGDTAEAHRELEENAALLGSLEIQLTDAAKAKRQLENKIVEQAGRTSPQP